MEFAVPPGVSAEELSQYPHDVVMEVNSAGLNFGMGGGIRLAEVRPLFDHAHSLPCSVSIAAMRRDSAERRSRRNAPSRWG